MMRNAILAIVVGALWFVLILIDGDRESITDNCLELGNSVSQCEKLFE